MLASAAHHGGGLVKDTMEIFIQQCKRDRLVLSLAMLLLLFAGAILGWTCLRTVPQPLASLTTALPVQVSASSLYVAAAANIQDAWIDCKASSLSPGKASLANFARWSSRPRIRSRSSWTAARHGPAALACAGDAQLNIAKPARRGRFSPARQD